MCNQLTTLSKRKLSINTLAIYQSFMFDRNLVRRSEKFVQSNEIPIRLQLLKRMANHFIHFGSKKNQTAEFLFPIVLIRWKCWHYVNSHFDSFVEKKRWKKIYIKIAWTFSEKFPDVIIDRFVKMCIFFIYLNFLLENPTEPSILEYSGIQVVVNWLERLYMLLSHHFCCCRCFDSICRDYNYQFEWAIDAINLIIRGFFSLQHSSKQKWTD